MERKKATYQTRMGAFIIDMFLIILLCFFFEFAVSRNVVGTNKNVKENLAMYELYDAEFGKIQDEYQIYIYDEDGKRIYNEDLTDETKQAFENDERVKQIRIDIRPYSQKVIAYAAIEYSIALFLATMVALFILPLIFKEGRTLGKLILKVAVRNKDDSDIKWYKVMLRWLFQLVFEILLGVLTLLITPLMSLICTALTRENYSLTDLVCKTRVIQDLPVTRANRVVFEEAE